MNTIFKAMLFALIAAAGNATFVFGQKRSVPGVNPFVFLACSWLLATALLVGATFFFPLPPVKAYLQGNWKAIVISAAGIFTTYLGFYFLYSRFGASYYIIYAVTSIVTTAILVGVVVLRETFNIYYLLSVFSAALTIVLFFIGQQQDR